MRAVVTGASGFVGRALCRSLVDEYESVVALVRGETDIRTLQPLGPVEIRVIPDALDDLIELFSQVEPEVVFHLATHYSRDDDVDISNMIESNVVLGTRILRAVTSVTGSPPSLVIAGSFFQHFRGNRALNLYASTKTAFRSIVEYYADAHGLCIAEVVLSDVYGPGSRRKKLVEAAIEAATTGAEFNLADDSDLVQLIYIDDAVKAFEAAARGLLGSHENCGARWFASPDTVMSIKDVLATVERVVGGQIMLSGMPLETPSRRMDELVTGDRPPGWAPSVDLAAGVARMWSS